MCKLLPFDTDLKVPFYVVGAGSGATPSEHIDLAPTVLDFLGVPIPSHMSGRSLSLLGSWIYRGSAQ